MNNSTNDVHVSDNEFDSTMSTIDTAISMTGNTTQFGRRTNFMRNIYTVVLKPLPAKLANIFRSISLLLVIFALWELYARLNPSPFFPPITDILKNYRTTWLSTDPLKLFQSDFFWEQGGKSLTRFGQAWALAIIVGVFLGVLLGSSRRLGKMYNPAVRFLASIPATILLPISVQIFGVGDDMNIFLIFLGSIGVIIINTCDGVAGVDPMWVRSAQSLQVSKTTKFRKVVIPAAMPQVMAGLRVSLGISLILMVIAELYATTIGLGHQIVIAQTSFRYLDMWSAFVVIGVIGIVLNVLFSLIERRVLRWQRRNGLNDL